MSEFLKTDKTINIRQPSTANLMIDSQDRANPNTGSYALQPSAFNFQIQRTNSILNGFFTRIGTTEVVLEWSEPNIRVDLSNNFLNINTAAAGDVTVTIPSPAFHNVADTMDAIVKAANALGTIGTWSVDLTTYASPALVSTVSYRVADTALARQLSLITSTVIRNTFNLVVDPDLRQFRYIDFVSSQLTYNQDLKDSSTAPIVRDVLCRWYFAWDYEAANDKYGYPIEMGYNAFVIRRLFSPPKQIRWSTSQPIGNLSFEVYGDNGLLVTQFATPSTRAPLGLIRFNTNWLMTLQVSEV
jgi:hypothetical protein